MALSFHKVGFRSSYKAATSIRGGNIEKTKKKQLEKFLRLIDYVKKNVPYYQEILSDIEITTIEDVRKIPFIDKNLIRSNIKKLKSLEKKDSKFIKNSTSGSSGEAFYFYSDKDDTYSLACAVRGDEMTGWMPGERKLIIWGAERDISKGIKAFLKKYLLGEIVVSSYYLNDETIASYINLINTFKPKLIVGYPSALYLIAENARSNNLVVTSRIRGVVSAGEALYTYQRDLIESFFGTRVFNRYGCREVGHIANECMMKNGLHYNADHLIIEVVDKQGKPSKSGELGEIVITDLDNYAFPMIRYKIGDMGRTMNYDECGCGTMLPKLESVEGRKFDIIVGKNGNRVSGSFWTLLMRYEIDGVEQFQVIQERVEEVIFKLKINGRFDKTEQTKLIHKVKEKLGEGMSVRIEAVTSFDIGPTGKFRWVISTLCF